MGESYRKLVFSFVEGKRKLDQIKCPLGIERSVWLKQWQTVEQVPQDLHVLSCQMGLFKEAKHLDFCVKSSQLSAGN